MLFKILLLSPCSDKSILIGVSQEKEKKFKVKDLSKICICPQGDNEAIQ
jgi:hypothetical protein